MVHAFGNTSHQALLLPQTSPGYAKLMQADQAFITSMEQKS